MGLVSVERIENLVDKMKAIEVEIEGVIKLLEQDYVEASSSMSDSQNYFLNGIQAAQVAKSYLLTKRGIEVLGEEVIPIPIFIDNVIRFANYPKRKIEVMLALANHLKKLYELNSETKT